MQLLQAFYMKSFADMDASKYAQITKKMNL